MYRLVVNVLNKLPANRSLIVFDGPDLNSRYVNIDSEEKFTASSFQVLILYENHKNYVEIVFGRNSIKDKIKNYNGNHTIRDKTILTSQNIPCSQLANTLCVFMLHAPENYYINITLLSLKYSGPNVGYCKYGGLSIYDNINRSLKEVLLLCDDLLTVIFNNQPKQVIVSSTQMISLIFYAYWPYSNIELNITMESTKCKGVHVLRYVIFYFAFSRSLQGQSIYIFCVWYMSIFKLKLKYY